MWPKEKPSSSQPRGDFSVRVGGNWKIIHLNERAAWESFLFECRSSHDVELLRGAVVVARLPKAAP